MAQPIPEIQRKYIARLSSFGGRFFEDKVICPKCLKKQIQNHGTYWRRIEWSMYGMDICPKHGCRMLLDNSFRSLKSVEISLHEKKYIEKKKKKTELWVENISLLINKKLNHQNRLISAKSFTFRGICVIVLMYLIVFFGSCGK